MVALATLLQSDSVISSLSLNDNRIGEEGAVKLAEVLTTNDTLQHLNLKMNPLGDNGNVQLTSEELPTVMHLGWAILITRVLFLGVSALIRSLGTNTSLASLNLNTTRCGDNALAALSDTLPSNRTLSWLDVSCNRMTLGPELHPHNTSLSTAPLPPPHTLRKPSHNSRTDSKLSKSPEAAAAATATTVSTEAGSANADEKNGTDSSVAVASSELESDASAQETDAVVEEVVPLPAAVEVFVMVLESAAHLQFVDLRRNRVDLPPAAQKRVSVALRTHFAVAKQKHRKAMQEGGWDESV